MNDDYSLIVPFYVSERKYCSESMNFLNGIITNSPHGEIIIVDNGSCAEWHKILKSIKFEPHVKIISEKERFSYSSACNLGAKSATKNIFCFLNSDVVFSSHTWSEPFIEKLCNDDVGIVGASGRKILPGTWLGGDIRYDNDIDYVEGWCVWITRETLFAVDGWDERYDPFYCEDSDLSFKVIYLLDKRLEIIPREKRHVKHVGGYSIKRQLHDGNDRIYLRNNANRLKNKWENVFIPGTGFKKRITEPSCDVAVLIPANVEEKYLIQCLDSLRHVADKVMVYVGLDRMKFSKRSDYLFAKFIDLNFGNVNLTRNYLFSVSNEPYVLFLDADDMIVPGAIEKMRIAMNEGYDIVYGKGLIQDESVTHWFRNQTNGYLNTYPFDDKKLRYMNYIPMPSLIRRSALPDGKPFDVDLPALHDWDLWLRMVTAGRKFKYLDEKCFVYRIHETNLSRDKSRWNDSILMLRKKHGDDIGSKNQKPKISVVTIAKTQTEIDRKIAEFKNQKTQPDEFCYSTHPDLATAWVEAIGKATGDIVVITETDTQMITDDFIGELTQGMNGNSNEIVKGIETNHTWENFANVAVSRRVLQENPITTEFGIGQDTEWYARCKSRGVKIKQVNRGHVAHYRGIATEKMLSRAYEYGRLNVRLIKKYGFFSMAEYIKRIRLQGKIAAETLHGIIDELLESGDK